MWTCPKCGREFKRTNQGHYCGKAPENVDEYIELQITEAREHDTVNIGAIFDADIIIFQIVTHHFSHCCFLWAVFSSCHKNNLQTE